jgi:thiol-disulfide isomerase/thioredoxin
MRTALLALAFCFVAFAEETPVKTLDIGAAAPAFSLPGIDNATYTLDSFKDAKVLAIVFTCNHCPTAQAYEARLQQLHDDYKDKGVAVVAVNPNDPLALRLDELAYSEYNDTLEDMKLRAKDINITYPYLDDGEKQAMARAYGPVATPHVFIFDAARTLRYRGRIDDGERGNNITTQDTRNAIEALLAGKPVPVETTPSMGCSTKWSDKRKSVADALEKWAQEPVTLNDIDAKGITDLLKNDTKKLRLVNLFATWCPPCVAEFPDLMEIRNIFRPREFEMVFLNLDDPRQKDRALDFLKKHHASTTNYNVSELDTEKLVAAIGNDWQGEIPLTLLVAPGGKVIHKTLGTIEPLEIKKAILSHLGRAL